MATLYADISEQPPTYTWDARGFSATRTFKLDNVNVGTPPTVIASILGYPGLPLRGDPHPGDPNIQADSISIEAITSTQFKATVSYRRLSAATGEPSTTAIPLPSLGSTVQEGETIVDAFGSPLNVAYLPQGDTTQTVQVQPAIATVQRPNAMIRFTRREPSPGFDITTGYTGYTNASPFLGAAPNTMLCTRIESNSQDDGYSWMAEYEFQFRPETWTVGVYFLVNGQIPPNDSTI